MNKQSFSTNKPKLLVTGATGLVGSRFLDLYKNRFSILTIGRNISDIKVDLTSKEEVLSTVLSSDAEIVINFAAFTNVDRAEKEKGKKTGEVYTLNALLPLWLAKACKISGKILYHISTDYVFNGKKETRPYTEEDLPDPIDSWYALSKYDGETNVQEIFGGDGKFVIVRISYPYRVDFERKLDFARVIVDKLRHTERYFGCTDQKIKPVFIDDIAKVLVLLIEKRATGIYHVGGKYPKGYISPFEFAQEVAFIMNLDSSLIRPISFAELSKKRIAPRPRNTWIDTTKIEKLGMKFLSLDEALNKLKGEINP